MNEPERTPAVERRSRPERRRAPSLPEGHLAALVLDAVEQLRPGAADEPPGAASVADPLGSADGRRFTALLIYSYTNGAVSSRAIERATDEDPAQAFLAGRHCTHDELRGFRRAHRVALVNVFVDVFRLCEAAGMVKLGQVALATARAPSMAGDADVLVAEQVPRSATALAEDAEALLARAEQEDREDDVLFGAGHREAAIPAELAHHESRVARLRDVKRELERQADGSARRVGDEVDESHAAFERWGIDAYVGEGRTRQHRLAPAHPRTLADLEPRDWDEDELWSSRGGGKEPAGAASVVKGR